MAGGQENRDEAEGNGDGAVTTAQGGEGESSGEDEREGGCEGAHGNMARTREARATREKI
jgi:hypothetical protein